MLLQKPWLPMAAVGELKIDVHSAADPVVALPIACRRDAGGSAAPTGAGGEYFSAGVLGPAVHDVLRIGREAGGHDDLVVVGVFLAPNTNARFKCGSGGTVQMKPEVMWLEGTSWPPPLPTHMAPVSQSPRTLYGL